MEPIAVIGYSFMFPQGADSSEDLWRILEHGINTSQSIPKDRFDYRGFYSKGQSKTGAMNVHRAHFIESDIAAFDAPFFGISPEEAAAMDPQQRLLLEVSYKALENSGLPLEVVAGSKTSVHVGSFISDYKTCMQKDVQNRNRYFATGTEAGMLANRLSWYFDLSGPSMQIDTACSSSLTALHVACQGLRLQDADMGLVGGCNLFFTPEDTIAMSQMGFLSPDGISYSFDERANGYARGEGIGVVVLKLLSRAMADGDTIRGIIRATGSNQDGRTSVITQPSTDAQAELIRSTYRAAGLDLDRTMYFEAHGTGTPVGDPLEASAINAVFGNCRSPADPIYVGALKSNIGHLEGASGIAGLIKTMLVLERGEIPKNAWTGRSNPNIALGQWCIKFPSETLPWPTSGLRRASINSFGFGGSNAHAILDDVHGYLKLLGLDTKYCTRALNGRQPKDEQKPVVLLLSSSDEGGRDRAIPKFQKYLVEAAHSSATFLHDLAFTLAEKRSQLPWKSYAVASCIAELQQPLGGKFSRPTRSMEKVAIGFVFTGQGAQWRSMAKELFAYRAFRDGISECNMILNKLGLDFPLSSDLFSSKDVRSPRLSQPICTALQMALVGLLRSWNIEPVAVVGHSSGEIAAAYCAGAIDARSALEIAYYRGVAVALRNPRERAQESMMAVGMSEEDAKTFLGEELTADEVGDVCVACINSPINVTLSGHLSVLKRLHIKLVDRGVFVRMLDVDVAYHSRSMDDAAWEYGSLLGHLEVKSNARGIAFFSSLEEMQLCYGELTDASYWVRNLTNPVKFSGAVSQMYGKVDYLLEIGPQAALRSPIRSILASLGEKDVRYGSVLVRDKPATVTALGAAAELYCLGYPVDMASVNRGEHLGDLNLLTNVPEYQFNHAQRYWNEGRYSRNFRQRQDPEHELLGIPAADWNPLNARWRKVLRTLEVGWIADHVVDGSVLYPGAAMLLTAVEAVRRLVGQDKKVSSFELRDIRFTKAIVLSLEQDKELEICLRPCSNFLEKASLWREFELFVLQGNEWSECCRGKVVARFGDPTAKADDLLRIYQAIRAQGKPCETQELYNRLGECGLQYGPNFQVLRRACLNPASGEAAAEVSSSISGADYPIHPTAVDGIFQLTVPSLVIGEKKQAAAMLPTSLESMWIDAEALRGTASFWVRSAQEGLRTAKSSAAAFDNNNSLALTIHGLRTTCIDRTSESGQETQGPLCYQIDWEPDIDLLERQQVDEHCPPDNHAVIVKDIELLEEVTKYFVGKALEQIKYFCCPPHARHLQKYYEWMQTVRRPFPKHIPSGLEKLPLGEQEMMKRVGQSLPRILDGTVGPLETIFLDDSIDLVYENQLKNSAVARLKSWLKLRAYKNPAVKILEVGAGTGAMTRVVMDALTEGTSLNFDTYVFTDISKVFFEKAQNTLAGWPLTFLTLDLERDATEQGFRAGEFDMIIASNTLHATKCISSTLRNLARILKPGGQLVLSELTSPKNAHNMFIYGLMEGWWLGQESFREACPLLEPEDWNTFLTENGYSGLDVHWPDDPDRRDASVMISTLTPEPADFAEDVTVVIDGSLQSDLGELVAKLSASRSQVLTYAELIGSPTSRNYIFLNELIEPTLVNMSAGFFSALQKICGAAETVLWVSERSDKASGFGMAPGLARTLRSEAYEVKFATLVLDSDGEQSKRAALVAKAFAATASARGQKYEPEFEERDGTLLISRILPNETLSDLIPPYVDEPVEQELELNLTMGSPGMIDSLEFAYEMTQKGPLADGQVEVDVEATGLIFRDILIAMGVHGDSQFGLQFAGVVSRAMPETQPAVGSRVFGWGRKAFGSRVRCSSGTVIQVPVGIPPSVAATLPVACCTAVHCLLDIARLKRGDAILIHSAAGGTGQAAVQLSQHLGIEIFATVGTEEKQELLMSTYGIPADHIFASRDTRFKDQVWQATGGRGVDAVLNSLADEALYASIECLAPFGCFLQIGSQTKGEVALGSLPGNARFAAVDLSHVLDERPGEIKILMERVVDLMSKKVFAPFTPTTTFDADRVGDAFRYMQQGKSGGGIAIEMTGLTLRVPKPMTPCRFNADATYVVAGGLGGLGRGICRWMAAHGAKHLLLLSRASNRTSAAAQLIDELRSSGVTIEAPSCDIADKSALELTLERCRQTVPPIRGCIQAALALTDKPFVEMTCEEFNLTTRPKVAGTWNLCMLLPDDLDFFVSLSSIAGITGNASQANYACGSVYQDTLARRLAEHGRRIYTIDLGVVKDAGYVADHQAVEYLAKMGYDVLDQAEVLKLLNYCCSADRPPPTPCESQILTRIRSVADLEAANLPEPAWMARPLFAHVRHAGRRGGAAESKQDTVASANYASLLAAADTLEEATGVVCDGFVAKLSRSMAIPAEDVDVRKPPAAYGIDSLGAVEVHNWLVKEMAASVPVFRILSNSSVLDLARSVVDASGLVKQSLKSKDGS